MVGLERGALSGCSWSVLCKDARRRNTWSSCATCSEIEPARLLLLKAEMISKFLCQNQNAILVEFVISMWVNPDLVHVQSSPHTTPGGGAGKKTPRGSSCGQLARQAWLRSARPNSSVHAARARVAPLTAAAQTVVVLSGDLMACHSCHPLDLQARA